MDGDHLAAVHFEDLQTGDQVTVKARYVLDATEEGDLLPWPAVSLSWALNLQRVPVSRMPYWARLL
jgi:hypothetical protein